jgi:hypothetical protein
VRVPSSSLACVLTRVCMHAGPEPRTPPCRLDPNPPGAAVGAGEGQAKEAGGHMNLGPVPGIFFPPVFVLQEAYA